MLLNLSNLLMTFLIAQTKRGPGTTPADDAGACAAGGGMMIFGVCCCLGLLAFALVPMIGAMKVFAKAGEPGIAAIVPIWNYMVFAKIAGKPDNRWIFYLIPVAGGIFAIIDLFDFARAYGKEGGFAVGMLLLPFVFWPILGFGSAKYVGLGAGSSGGGSARRRPAQEDEDDNPPQRRRRPDDY